MKNIHTPVSKLKYFILFSILTILCSTQLSAQYLKIKEFLSDSGNNLSTLWGYHTLISDGDYLYGMTNMGGNYGLGTVFKVRPDGTGLQKLLDFDGINKGAEPYGSLTLSGSLLYGMTVYGGKNSYGVIFKISTDGSGFQKIFDFNGADSGYYPDGSLIIDGNVLYGVTGQGGAYSEGTIFKINTNGSGFQIVHDFEGGDNGNRPNGPLTLVDDSLLYGMTNYGGPSGWGIIFKININGTGFQRIFDLDDEVNGGEGLGGLIYSDSMLYGMCRQGGTSWEGVIFKFSKDGTTFQVLHNFNGNNGSLPEGSLVIANDTLYGMTPYGGIYEMGTAFKIHINGTGFQKLIDFEEINNPRGSFVMVGSTLYGIGNGGTLHNGVIFKLNTDGSGFSTIKNFFSCQAGESPGGIIKDGLTIYGTAGGGLYNEGIIYKMNTNGTGFQKLFDFSYTENGSSPNGPLVLSNSMLYGTTAFGGEYDYGVVFKVNTDGSGFQKLIDFDGNNGLSPFCALTLSGSTLYGTTAGNGGDYSYGTIFKIDTNGNGFQKLFDFDGINGNSPYSSLTLSGSTLYGSIMRGGDNDFGVVFKINTDGTGFQKLFDMDVTTGSYPMSSLTLSDSTLYGSTHYGGDYNYGTVFKIDTNGSGFQKLLDFNKIKGSYPNGSFILDGSTLYGTSGSGGVNDTANGGEGDGVLFKIETNGTGFEKLLDFDGINIGRNPGKLVRFNNLLYGTCSAGGAENSGVVFKYYLVTPFLSVSPETINIAQAAGSNTSVTITSNDDWSASSSQTWLTLSDTAGYGDATITLTVTANSGATARVAIVTITGGGLSQIVTVTQGGINIVSLNETVTKIRLVYPNPCTDKLNIKLPSQLLPALVSIYSVDGEKISQFEVTDSETELDITDNESGIYVLQIITSEQTIVERIIKQ